MGVFMGEQSQAVNIWEEEATADTFGTLSTSAQRHGEGLDISLRQAQEPGEGLVIPLRQAQGPGEGLTISLRLAQLGL